MSSEERMRKALLVLAANLRGPGMDWRPLSYEFACKCADFADDIAHGRPHPQFDEQRNG